MSHLENALQISKTDFGEIKLSTGFVQTMTVILSPVSQNFWASQFSFPPRLVISLTFLGEFAKLQKAIISFLTVRF
jgi:hypothetical protein